MKKSLSGSTLLGKRRISNNDAKDLSTVNSQVNKIHKGEQHQFILRLPKEYFKKLKLHSVQNEVSIRELILDAVQEKYPFEEQ